MRVINGLENLYFLREIEFNCNIEFNGFIEELTNYLVLS
jgi:hypothetical protein